MSAWERGDVVIIERRISSYEAVALYQPDEFVATPVFLYQFLRNMPPQYQPRNRPQIQIASGKLSARLHQRAVERLGCEIICSYGMSERGTIGYSFGVEPGPEWIDRYRVVPWARVEIVDEKDAVQPEGSRGFVRVRSEGMPQTYIGDEALAERNLRDGWYYTGDIGVLHPGGILQIEGRENELINLSGVKIYHPKIEDDLQHIEGVTDAAVFSAPNRAGIEELCLAVVAPLEGRADIAARLREYIQRALSTLDGRHLIFVDAIPRNDSGKVMRRELIETFRQMREQREQRRAAAA
jgi:acyl-coenzyme A synthetase/AMP-(fatty) acid ligase